MSINACAALVERGDPDRFLAVMASPPAARAVLFPLYAFNLEVARAPWVTSEPMLAEIRLQWWRDALEDIRTGKPARRHEVVTPLAEVLDSQACELLTRIADARRWDIARAPFLSEAQFRAHLDATNGNLCWCAARLLGATDERAVRKVAFADALARWFQAVPTMVAAGLHPLVEDSDAALRGLAEDALDGIRSATLRGPTRVATLSAWEAGPILRQAIRYPERVRSGGLGLSPFVSRVRLLARTFNR